jgi:phospholipid/cholesterol/gamma-HCH transport system substrate-binding protein
VLLGLLGLTFLALKAANLGSSGGGDTYRVTANFDNIGGLKVRAPVRTAGRDRGAGHVDRARPQDLPGRGQLDIDRDYQFPKDSAAKILTAGLLGDQYVGLEPGGDLAAGDDKNLDRQFLYNRRQRWRRRRRARPWCWKT